MTRNIFFFITKFLNKFLIIVQSDKIKVPKIIDNITPLDSATTNTAKANAQKNGKFFSNSECLVGNYSNEIENSNTKS